MPVPCKRTTEPGAGRKSAYACGMTALMTLSQNGIL